ncbi:hypothetical protein H310_01476 [Aphanomyces invadans]|uniref:Transposase Tc1-like domain-containing protein n=1 Tax=Aphanomyces invadans TaxID=157072 RepID=A0A024USS9_9STRA|nr:hypothetical protein H310_01476 [Aphanomyces invadans]ETW09005.1 hypothetical protein H310_01476 [Aphanomyces invadans]|eukprot:XP_008862810.1 hypothetical protein H310_01476 [Aphanomyces invadans]
MTGRIAGTRKYSDEGARDIISNVPHHLRCNFHSLESPTGIPKTTLRRLLKAKKLRRTTNRLKPMLTADHRLARYNFAKSFMRAGQLGTRRWHDMMGIVHIDEKLFYITQVNRRFYLWHDEAVPQRKAQSKRHITKVMFLCAVARPRHDSQRHAMWDGKAGLWPFVETKLAKRKSKNRDRGTPVTVPMSVTKPIYSNYLIDKVFPAIQSKWPDRRGRPIFVQQDNTKPHLAADDAAVKAAGQMNGWNIQLTCVEGAFKNLKWAILDKTFMALQKVLEESMKMDSDNVYKLPHLKKDIQLKAGHHELRPSFDEEVLFAIDLMESRLQDEQRVDEIALDSIDELVERLNDVAVVKHIIHLFVPGLYPDIARLCQRIHLHEYHDFQHCKWFVAGSRLVPHPALRYVRRFESSGFGPFYWERGVHGVLRLLACKPGFLAIVTAHAAPHHQLAQATLNGIGVGHILLRYSGRSS